MALYRKEIHLMLLKGKMRYSLPGTPSFQLQENLKMTLHHKRAELTQREHVSIIQGVWRFYDY
jgi:hypothetical protein